MAIVVDEEAGTISFTDCTVTFPYGFNVSTGIGTITITPSGGVASFPLAFQGDSGLPPELTFLPIVEHEPGDPLPEVNPVVVVTDEGGPGEAAKYTIEIHQHKGDKGDAAAFEILDGDDIDGDVTDGYVLSKKPGEAKVVFIPMRHSDLKAPTAIAGTPWSNQSPRLLCTSTLPARPFPRKVIPAASVVVTGSVSTRVDIVAYLGDPDGGGVEIGRGFGMPGAAPPPVVMVPGPPNTLAGGVDGYAVIPADEEATVYFRAEQLADSAANWSTAAAPSGARASTQAIAV